MNKLLRVIFLVVGISTIYLTVSSIFSGEISLSDIRYEGKTIIKFSDSPGGFIGAVIFFFAFSILFLILTIPKFERFLENILGKKKKTEKRSIRDWLHEVDVLLKYGKNEKAKHLVNKLLKVHPENIKLLEYKYRIENS